MSERRVGLLGGTFDPIHLGHLKAAEAARAALGLTEVLLIPSLHPPHRTVEPVASSFHRFAMVALAAAGGEGLVASDLEMETPAPSYTSDTLRRLHERGYSPAELFFITGADAFAEIATWKDYPAVLGLSTFVVIDRPGADAAALERQYPNVRFIHVHTPDVSSTRVRQLLAARQSIEGLVPPLVAAHIVRHRLYEDRGAHGAPLIRSGGGTQSPG